MLINAAQWLEHTALATAIRDSMWGFPILITIHVLALGLFLGTVLLLDLRLIRRGVTDAPVAEMVDRVLPWSRSAFLVVALSGVLLFCTEAMKCSGSLAFRIKMALIALAGVNVWIFHGKTYRRDWAGQQSVPARATIAGMLSMLLWIGVLAAGRAVGYSY